MLGGWTVALVALAYIGALFAVAYFGDKWELRRISPRSRSIIYSLTLAIYCTSWTFFGSVGVASTSGFDFLPIYIGPILLMVFGWPAIRRIAQIAKSLNITSIADFLSARYGKSQRLAAVVTVIAVIGIIPYIALQLKAVSESVTVLIGPAAAETLPIGDIAFVVAMAMAVFTVLFGTRHIDTTEHQEGLMLAIAAESVVKLVAFLTVGGFITFSMLGGWEGLSKVLAENTEVTALFTRTPNAPLWLTQILLATSAVILLPRQFHVAVVENVNERDIRRAAWMFPLYLVAINIFVVPIAIAGMTLLPEGSNVNADMFMIAVPLSAGQPLLAMLAFIGGLSAATAMVIVATVALSIMICNDLAVPMMLRRQLGMTERADMGRLLLYIRRVAIFGVLLLSYAYFQAISSGFALASIGLLSFAAIAQFAPAFFGGMVWRRATERGAMAGILAGFFVWTYTLLLPSFDATGLLPAGLLAEGPMGISFLRPQALFGIDASSLTHGVGWSLFVNIAAFGLVSIFTRQSAVERMQASLFTRDGLPLTGAGFWQSRASAGVTVGELAQTAARYLGHERARRSFAEFESAGHGSVAPGDEAELPLVRYTERLLASAVGTASARLVMALLLERQDLAARGALKLLDDASEAIQYNRDLLQSAINHVDQGIGVFDDQMRLVCWNQQFRNMLGTPAALGRVGVPLRDLLHHMAISGLLGPGNEDDLVADRINRLVVTMETYTERLSPSGRVLEVSSRPMAGGGIVVTYNDITDKVVAAEALASANETLERRVRERTAELTELNKQLTRAKATADEVNVGKTRFLAAASHDILQPLNAARLYTTSLVERRTGTEVKRLAGNIDASLLAVEEILGALLDISRLDAGAAKPEITAVGLGELFSQLRLEFEPLAQAEGLRLAVVNTNAVIKSDRRLLRRVLQNLLSNAIKYTDQGGVLLGCRREGDNLRIEVHDTGSGIPQDQQKSIFQEFHRLEGKTARVRGLGLGLSIVERIVGILNMSINISSVMGVGSAFTLIAERATDIPAQVLEPSVPRGQAGRLSGLLVLAIDNEPQILDGMQTLLTRWGCEVAIAHGRADIDNIVGALPRLPDIVLADYHLDAGTGIEIIQYLRQTLDPDIPAALLTADRSHQLKQLAEKNGLQILNKPIKPAALRALIAQIGTRRVAAE